MTATSHPRVRVPAVAGAHYTSSLGYPDGWAEATPHATADGSDAYVYIEVGITEGYTMGRITPEDAERLAVSLIQAATITRQEQKRNRRVWYGDAR